MSAATGQTTEKKRELREIAASSVYQRVSIAITKRFIRPDPAEVQQISTSSGRRLLFVSPFSRCTGILKCSQQDLLLSFETTSPFPLEMTLRNHTGSLGEGH